MPMMSRRRVVIAACALLGVLLGGSLLAYPATAAPSTPATTTSAHLRGDPGAVKQISLIRCDPGATEATVTYNRYNTEVDNEYEWWIGWTQALWHMAHHDTRHYDYLQFTEDGKALAWAGVACNHATHRTSGVMQTHQVAWPARAYPPIWRITFSSLAVDTDNCGGGHTTNYYNTADDDSSPIGNTAWRLGVRIAQEVDQNRYSRVAVYGSWDSITSRADLPPLRDDEQIAGFWTHVDHNC